MEPSLFHRLGLSRPGRHRHVRFVGGAAGGAEAAGFRHLPVLCGGHRGRRRHGARPADRRAGVLGARQLDPADLRRRGTARLVHAAWPVGAQRAGVGRRGRHRGLCDLWRGEGAELRHRAAAGDRHGRADRLFRRDHPRPAGRRAVDPAQAGVLRDRGGGVGGADGRAERGGFGGAGRRSGGRSSPASRCAPRRSPAGGPSRSIGGSSEARDEQLSLRPLHARSRATASCGATKRRWSSTRAISTRSALLVGEAGGWCRRTASSTRCGAACR